MAGIGRRLLDAIQIRGKSAARSVEDAISPQDDRFVHGSRTERGCDTGCGHTHLNKVEGPRFTHDCETCIFLGRFDDGKDGQQADLYFHDSSPGGKTVIARYSGEGSNYVSGLPLVGKVEVLTEAFRRAEERGLVSRDDLH
jgi:hypothetical protein